MYSGMYSGSVSDTKRLVLFYRRVGTQGYIGSTAAISFLKRGQCMVDEWGNPMTVVRFEPDGWDYIVVAQQGSIPFLRTMEALARETRPRL